jgi:hypothetical protein
MNYKALLDKLAELEARIEMLEQGQRKQIQFPGTPQYQPAPVFVSTPAYHQQPPPWQITCKTNTGQAQ